VVATFFCSGSLTSLGSRGAFNPTVRERDPIVLTVDPLISIETEKFFEHALEPIEATIHIVLVSIEGDLKGTQLVPHICESLANIAWLV
jgi:hypothetical protein